MPVRFNEIQFGWWLRVECTFVPGPSFDGWARDTCTYVRMDAQDEVWIDWIRYERSLVQWSWTCSDSRHVGRTKLPRFERGMDRADRLASPQHGPS
jgi:hypothetical protein